MGGLKEIIKMPRRTALERLRFPMVVHLFLASHVDALFHQLFGG